MIYHRSMNLKILCAFVVLILLSPKLTLAFAPENDIVLRVTDDTWLYVNTSEYGSDNEEVSLPIAAVPSWVPRISGEYLRYQVLLSDRVFSGLDVSAILLSNAPIKGNKYVVPASETYNFTLIALITIPESSQSTMVGEVTSLSIEVTSLPK
jgi:hypothetical protein